MSSDVVIKVDNVGKKYCRSPKRSMFYGVQDIARDVLGCRHETLNLRRDEFWAIEDVSFELRQGECLAIVGANGAGKSTLLKMINGIFLPDRGSIATNGTLGALIEIGAGFHPMLSGRENIYINGAILGVPRKTIDKRFDEIVDFSGLENFIDMPVKHYSSGMYVRLGFSVAACLTPNILLLDEVLAVGDAHFRHKCFKHMKKLLDQGVALVLVTHAMNDLLRVATRTLVLDDGEVAFDGANDDGIACYERCLFDRNRDASPTQSGTRYIENMQLIGENGEIVEGVNTFDDVMLAFTLSHDVDLSAVEVRFVLDSIAYGPIATLSSRENDVVEDFSGSSQNYLLRVKRLPLLRGYYNVHAHLFLLSSGEYMGSQMNVSGITVNNSDLRVPHLHLLALDSEWKAGAGSPPEEG